MYRTEGFMPAAPEERTAEVGGPIDKARHIDKKRGRLNFGQPKT
jgi:hypothetical protein